MELETLLNFATKDEDEIGNLYGSNSLLDSQAAAHVRGRLYLLNTTQMDITAEELEAIREEAMREGYRMMAMNPHKPSDMSMDKYDTFKDVNIL